MKAIIPERAFPRGGVKSKNPKPRPPQFNLFKSKKKKKETPKHKKSKSSINPEKPEFGFQTVNELSSKDITPGQLLLGCVCEITDTQIHLNLPGGSKGFVNLNEISDTYSKIIQSNLQEIPVLNEIFELGQYFTVEIMSPLDASASFYVSLNPKLVNARLSKSNVTPGMILIGAVTSKEEHGYIIDLGVKKLQCFLKSDKVKGTLKEGQLIRVVVLSIKDHLVELSSLQKDLSCAFTSENVSVDYFIPGFQFKLVVHKIVKNGVEVELVGRSVGTVGFVPTSHLSKLFNKTGDVIVGNELKATLMYLLPLVKTPVFKLTKQQMPGWGYQYGDITSGTVASIAKNGLYLKIGDEPQFDKCFVPLSGLDKKEEIITKKLKLSDLYPIGKPIPQVRIMHKNFLERYYVGLMDKKAINTKFFCVNDVKVGEVVKGEIAAINEDYIKILFGRRIKGYINKIHIERGNITKFKPGNLVKARVLSVNKKSKSVRLTLKSSLISSKEPILKSFKSAKLGQMYLGTVVKTGAQFLIVAFYKDVKGRIDKIFTPFADEPTLIGKYLIGQVVKCYVVGCKAKNLKLSLLSPVERAGSLEIGAKYKVDVATVTNRGLLLRVFNNNEELSGAFIPKSLLTMNSTLAPALLQTYKIGDTFEAYCVSKSVSNCLFTIHPYVVDFYENHLNRDKNVTKHEILPFSAYFNDEKTHLRCLVKKASTNFKTNEIVKEKKVVMGKIMNDSSTDIEVSLSTQDVWQKHYMSSLNDLHNYLMEWERIVEHLKAKGDPLGANLGLTVHGKANLENQTVLLQNNCEGKCHKKLHKTDFEGTIVWIDVVSKIIWLHPSVLEKQRIEDKSQVRAKIVHKEKDVVVAVATGSHEFIFIPTRRHINDFETFENNYVVGEITKLKTVRFGNYLLGIDKKIAQKHDGLKRKLTVPHQKLNKKLKKDDDIEILSEFVNNESSVKLEEDSDEEINVGESNDNETEIKEESEQDEVEEISESEADEPPKPVEVAFNWSVMTNPSLLNQTNGNTASSDSESEEDVEDENAKKRKKLSARERKEKARLEEERLRMAEQRLMDFKGRPATVEDFDRLVCAVPDDSSVWLQYMAFHLENTEIEKARSVARRALNTISFRLEQDKLNIWLALLNLEHSYGTAESQRATLEEALRCNDPFPVHLHQLSFGGEEAKKLAGLMLKKYGDRDDVFSLVGKALMEKGMIEEARGVLQKALNVLPNHKHVPVISSFAQLENKYGSPERAHTLYEHILSAFPKRVDVWCSYADLLVKSNQPELARKVLERATAQTLPMKKMKTIFKKFISLEEKFGTEEDLERVRSAAMEYLEDLIPK